MQTILFFTPYTAWMPHTLWEATMGHALRQRGHSVRFLTCSGLPNCGMAPMPLEDREPHCSTCRNFTTSVLPRLRHTADFFQTVITGKEKTRAEEWADALPVEELETACYAGLPLGAWTKPDMISRWHTLRPRMERPEVEQSYRLLLAGAAQAALALPRLYDKHSPDAIVTLNGTFFLSRVAVEIARARNIRVIIHERGWMDNTVGFVTSGVAGDMAGYQERWQAWKEAPLTRPELEAVSRLLMQRRQGTNMNWSAFSPVPQGAQNRAQINAALGLKDKPFALLCTSSDCEGSVADRARAIDQLEWIEQTAQWFGTQPQFNLVVRVHPHEQDHARTDDRVLQWYRGLRNRLPANTRLIMPDERISTYSLMDEASAGLSYGSTAGLEMACLGLPLAHAGMGYYKDCGFTREVRGAADIPGVMAQMMESVQNGERDANTQRMAYRFMQRLFLDICIPFSKVKISSDYFDASLNYQSIAELAPGRDLQLDRIAEYILGNAPLFPSPAPADLARTTEEENAFFAALNEPQEQESAAAFRPAA